MNLQVGTVAFILAVACSCAVLRGNDSEDEGPCETPDESVPAPSDAQPVFPAAPEPEGAAPDTSVTEGSLDPSTSSVGPVVAIAVDPLPLATRAEQLSLTGSIDPEATLQLELPGNVTVFVPVEAGQWQAQLLLEPGKNDFRLTACKDARRASVEVSTRRVGFANIAHRGASVLAPENTLAAFRRALLDGAHDIELDVQRSRDGRAMVIHDQTTGRTAGVDLVVKDTDSTRLRELDVGSRFGPEYAGERIPFLEEVLAALPQGHRAWIEMKSGEDVVPIAAALIQDRQLEGQVVIQSFYLSVLQSFQRLAPGIPLWQIRVTAPTASELDLLTQLQIGGLILRADAVTDELLAAAYARNLGVVAWTIDDVAQASALHARFVEGVMTNRPDLITPIGAGSAQADVP